MIFVLCVLALLALPIAAGFLGAELSRWTVERFTASRYGQPEDEGVVVIVLERDATGAYVPVTEPWRPE